MNLQLFSFSVRRAGAACAAFTAISAWLLMPMAFAFAAGIDPNAAAQSLTQANLPIAAVTVHPAQHPVGTAFFIPQEHQSPGTSASDPQNDAAVVAQQQIAQIVTYLTQQGQVPYVMMEGYTYGPVPSDQLSLVKNEEQASKDFATALPEMQGACTSAAAQACHTVLSGAQGMAQDLNRALILQGGELDDKAAGESFALYGGEDQSLLDQGATIVRDNVYLTDRLSQLQGNASSGSAGGAMIPAQNSGSSSLLQVIAALMAQRSTRGVQASDLQALESGNSPALTRAAQDMGTAVDAFNAALSQKQQINAKHAQNLPSRQNNPYADITNPARIEQLLQQNNNQIQSTIVDARNSAAADNFVKGLAATNSNAGVLIYGSGHSAGLIPDLNQKGITVIDVVPQEVGITDPSTLGEAGSPNATQATTATGFPMRGLPSGLGSQNGMPSMGMNPLLHTMGMNPMMGGMGDMPQTCGMPQMNGLIVHNPMMPS